MAAGEADAFLASLEDEVPLILQQVTRRNLHTICCTAKQEIGGHRNLLQRFASTNLQAFKQSQSQCYQNSQDKIPAGHPGKPQGGPLKPCEASIKHSVSVCVACTMGLGELYYLSW